MLPGFKKMQATTLWIICADKWKRITDDPSEQETDTSWIHHICAGNWDGWQEDNEPLQRRSPEHGAQGETAPCGNLPIDERVYHTKGAGDKMRNSERGPTRQWEFRNPNPYTYTWNVLHFLSTFLVTYYKNNNLTTILKKRFILIPTRISLKHDFSSCGYWTFTSFSLFSGKTLIQKGKLPRG